MGHTHTHTHLLSQITGNTGMFGAKISSVERLLLLFQTFLLLLKLKWVVAFVGLHTIKM